MKVLILCGGRGMRMHELTRDMPKPLVPIAGMPMLWHIMKLYKHYGFDDFILLLGYRETGSRSTSWIIPGKPQLYS